MLRLRKEMNLKLKKRNRRPRRRRRPVRKRVRLPQSKQLRRAKMSPLQASL